MSRAACRRLARVFQQGWRLGDFAVEGCITSPLNGLLILAMANMPLLEMKVKSSSLL
jgi:hypothetical protein